jgi:hypothetical protein
MKTKSLFVIAVVVLPLILLSGCAALGKLAAGMMTSTTSDLSVCAVQGMYITNLYPRETKTIEMDYVPADWQPGKSGVAVSFFKREGIGFYKVDGAVTMDGDTLPYLANGVYSIYFDKSDGKSKKISITTSTGQKAQFTIQAPKSVKLVSVNGSNSNVILGSINSQKKSLFLPQHLRTH